MSLSLTNAISESIESVCRPVALCFPEDLMVAQISPGRCSVCIFSWQFVLFVEIDL